MAEQLTCGGCGFSNEPERVYCHNCGAKLDRSLLPTVEADKSAESMQTTRKRIKKMTNPAGYTFGQFCKSLIGVIFWAALVASLFLISQAPDGVPEEKNDLPQRLIQSELMEVVESPVSRTIAFTEADVNGALKQALRRATISSLVPGVELKRAYARLFPGVIRLGMQHSLWGYPLHSGVDYQLKVVDGKFTPVLLGGNFGRLPVPALVMHYAGVGFQSLWAALQREQTKMDRMQSVTLASGQIIFVTKPAGTK